MNNPWLILLPSCLAGVLIAQEPEAPDPAAKFGPEARSAYLRWEKATFEANVAYVSELKAALESATRQGKLDEAVAIRGEIERVSKLSGSHQPSPLADFLPGTSWVSESNGVVVVLREGGKGLRIHQGRESEITWRIDSETEFTVQWPVGALGRFSVAEDRQSVRGGDVTWKLQR